MKTAKVAVIEHTRTGSYHEPDLYRIIDQASGVEVDRQLTQDKACDSARKLGYQALTARKA